MGNDDPDRVAAAGRPQWRSGSPFPTKPPRGRSGRHLLSTQFDIPERNNAIYHGHVSPPQADALRLAVRGVSVCFPTSTKIRCTGSESKVAAISSSIMTPRERLGRAAWTKIEKRLRVFPANNRQLNPSPQYNSITALLHHFVTPYHRFPRVHTLL